MLSRFCISRPIFATVLSIIVVLAGLMAMKILPLSQYPNITPPTVRVSTTYDGADALTIARTVAAPIEDQLSGVEGLLYYTTSIRNSGDLSISCVFEVGTDPNDAMLEINNRVRAAERRLPEVVRTYGVNVRKRSEETLLSVALSSPDHSMEAIQLADYANLNMVDELKRLPGIGDVAVVGNTQSAMRIWLDPEKMGMLGIAVKDVEDAVKEQNAQKTAGSLGGSPATDDQQLTYRMTAQGQLLTPEQFGNIILRSDGPEGVVHLKDIARTEVGKRSYGMRVDINGEPGVNINIYLQTGANAMAAAQAVKERLAEMKKHFPKGRIDYTINDDTTVFVGAALHEVYQTLAEAGLLVLAVVFLFLQSWRATLIPMLAVPVSLIGTFAGLWLFGFSMNTLTLFAMVLAIGIVVDDAIVVLENVERLMVREGLGAFDASVKAMQEVSGALVAIVLVLCAVFIPVAFLGGIAGELYRQFAVTVATSVVLSGFVALTLTPALCAILLKSPASGEQKFIGFRLFNKGLEHFTNGFLFMVRLSLRHRILSGLGLILVTLTGWQMLVTTPTSFIPKEDQGVVRVSIQLPEAAAFPRTDAVGVELLEKFRRIEGVKTVVTMLGYDTMSNDRRSNAATFILQLKPWDERVSSADDIRRRIQKILAEHPDLKGSASLPASIRGLGSASGFSGYVLARGNDNPLVLQEAMDAFFQALSERSELTSLRSYLNADTPQYHLRVDEEKAAAMGVSLDDLFTTVSHLTDSKYVNDFTRNGKIYRVVVQADAPFRMGPDNLDRMYVRSSSTKRMIPVGSLVTVERTSGASSLARMNGYLAAQFSGQAVLGVSSGDAIRIVEEVAEEVLPEGFTVAWTGQAYHEKRIGSSSVTAVSFGLLMMFLILAALYERWSLPVAVVLTVPYAFLGAMISLWIRSSPNDIYFQIGLLVLIGLTAKNAILIVEFAAQKLEEGLSPFDAALEAARLRLRPILMTSAAFILGVVPLLLATGAGASARHSMGTGVFGGMLAATFVSTIFVPVFFTWFARRRRGGQSAGC